MDKIIKIGGSTIQHGPENRRIYLMKLDPADLPGLIPELNKLAAQHGYGKIFAKIPAEHVASFTDAGYEAEARVPGYYRRRDDAVFLGLYIKPERRKMKNSEKLSEIVKIAADKAELTPEELPSAPFAIRECQPDDAEAMVQVYKQVFASYPFPIHDPEYLRRTMRDNVAYFCACDKDDIVALASAEMDKSAGSAEMTDFATLPACRGKGIALHLLHRMENAVPARGIRTAYTIARACSPGMNITFGKAGYEYGGTLNNNTQIAGNIESMNVWYKALS